MLSTSFAFFSALLGNAFSSGGKKMVNFMHALSLTYCSF